MANPTRRGQVGSEVSTQMQSADYTPWANTHFNLPYGLRLQQRVGMVDITNVSGNGTTVTYTAANNYSAGNVVSIYDVNPVAYNLLNATIASASATQFTITNAATGTYVSGGIAQRTGVIPVTIPDGINFVYAIAVGGGGLGNTGGGGAGGVAWGWTLVSPTCVIANSNTAAAANYTRYGNVIAGYGGFSQIPGVLGGGGTSHNANTSQAGGTNYWGVPGAGGGSAGGINGGTGAGGGGGYGGTSVSTSGNGGNGISGGGGGLAAATGSQTNTGGNGGSGLVGGGGGNAGSTTGTRIGGAGGTGINLLTGAVTTGGTGTTGTNTNGAGGGGGGVVTSGINASGNTAGRGGLGGGGGGAFNGAGGAGILYLFY